MTELANGSSLSPIDVTPEAAPNFVSLRTARVTRAATLFVVGIAIAFTAPLHESFTFNRWVLLVAFALLGLATLFEYFAQRKNRAHGFTSIRALLMFIAAIAVLLSNDSLGLTIVVAAWAVANAIVLFATAIHTRATRGQALPAALLGLVLAVAVVIFRNDPVGVIGFFGMYAFISGVFLGITAFDTRVERGTAPSTATPGNATNSAGSSSINASGQPLNSTPSSTPRTESTR